MAADIIEFEATEVGGEVCNDVLSAGAAEPHGKDVLFSRGLSEDLEGIPPYFEFSDQSHGGYAVVESCRLTRNRLSVGIDGGALGLDGINSIHVALVAADEDWADLRDRLLRIFQGFDTLLVIAP